MKSLLSRSVASFLFVLVAACGSSGGDGQGGAALNGGIGQVCNGSGANECASGLSCRSDTSEWIAHHECTTSCQSDADCTSHFGSHTMCIGAHVCVSKCLDDSDCPTSTHCSENGWCAHDGPGSGVPKCSGVPSSCESLGENDCALTLGCTSGGACTGVSQSCSQQDEFSCSRTSGCYWSSSSGTCSGSPLPCSYNTSQYVCADQPGCGWRASCSGAQTATTCASQDATLCKYTTGCSLVPQ